VRKVDELSSRVGQIEDLVRVPSVIGHFASAKSLAMSIARQAPNDDVANLAMQLAAEVGALKESELPLSASNVHLDKILRRLRLALEQAKKGL
jgi:chemotaxis protein CheY-P-specific phosphatase CheC